MTEAERSKRRARKAERRVNRRAVREVRRRIRIGELRGSYGVRVRLPDEVNGTLLARFFRRQGYAAYYGLGTRWLLEVSW